MRLNIGKKCEIFGKVKESEAMMDIGTGVTIIIGKAVKILIK